MNVAQQGTPVATLRIINAQADSTFLSRALHGWLPEGWEWQRPDSSTEPASVLVYSAPNYRTLCSGNREDSDRLWALLGGARLEQLRAGSACLLIDMTNEAPAGSEIEAESLIASLADLGIDPSLVHLASMNAQLSDDVSSLGCSSHLVDSYALDLAHLVRDQEQRALHEELQNVVARRDFTGKFLCLNATPRPPRVALMSALVRDGLVDRNFVSWGGWGHHKALEELSSARDRARELLQPWLQDVLPYVDHVMDMGPIRFDAPGVAGNALSFRIPWTAYAATDFSIVTEPTVGPSHWRVTEKSVKALVGGHLPLVLGHRRTYDLLSSYGFQLPSPGLLTAYDLADSPNARLAILRDTWRLLSEKPSLLESYRASALWNMTLAREGLLEHLRARQIVPLFEGFARSLAV